MTIKVNLEPLESVSTLTYLGHNIALNNINWTSLYQNMRKSQRIWVMISGVLVKARTTVQNMAFYYKEVV